MKRLLIGSLLLATTGLACGSLPEDEGDPSTLVTLNGAVSSTSGSLGSGKVGVALLWYSSLSHAVAAEIAPESASLNGFSLAVTQPPPKAFMGPLDDDDPKSTKGAWAMLVAYEDLNGNGKLDLLDVSSTKAIDKIVARDADRLLVYLDGAPPPDLTDPTGAKPQPGFNIASISKQGDEFAWVPLSTKLVLTEDASDDAQSLMCVDGTMGTGSGSTTQAAPGVKGPDGEYPSASDPNLSCEVGDNQYGYSIDTVVYDGPCYQEHSIETTIYTHAEATPPAGWPCPAN